MRYEGDRWTNSDARPSAVEMHITMTATHMMMSTKTTTTMKMTTKTATHMMTSAKTTTKLPPHYTNATNKSVPSALRIS